MRCRSFYTLQYGYIFIDRLLIEACLSHADQNEVRASYNRSDYLEQRKEIMSWWSRYIEEAAQGSFFMDKE